MSRFAPLALVAVVLIVAGALPLTATAASPVSVRILSSHLRTNDFGERDVLGEVANDGRVPVRLIRVFADFLDSAGRVIDSSVTETALHGLNPGERSTFDVLTDSDHAAGYRLRLTYLPSDVAANHNFTVTIVGNTTDPDNITYVDGTIRNDNTTRAEFVRAEITFLSEAGVAVDAKTVDVGDSEPYAIGPGETQPFSFVLFNQIPYARMTIVGDSSTQGLLPITLHVPRGGFPPMYGSTVQLTGSAAPGASVTIQRWDVSGSWIVLAHGVADSAGRFAIPAKITTTWFVRAVTDEGQSVGIASMQRAKVTFAPSTSAVRKGATVTFSGTVRPVAPGAKVTIEQLKGINWATIGTATLNSSSAFTFRWKAKSAGTFSFRAKIGMQSDSTESGSGERKVVVRP